MKANVLKFVSGVVLLGASALNTAQATPWADANDAQVRHYLQVLADAGVVQFSANTYPVMWGALLENMQAVDARALAGEQQYAYFYVLSVLEFHAAGGYTGAVLHGQSRTGAQRGFVSAGGSGGGVSGSEKAALTLTRDFKTDHSAFRLKTTYRTGREALPWRENDPQSISFAGSYAATIVSHDVLGSWVVGVDQLPTWWSPSYEHDGMHTRSERPLQALRVTRAGAAEFTSSALHWLGPWSASAYVGRSERALGVEYDKRAREEAFGVRVTATPHTRLQLGSRFTGAHLGYTQKNAAVDARYVLFNGSFNGSRVTSEAGDAPSQPSANGAPQLALYGELIYHDSALSTTYHTVGVDMHLPLVGQKGSAPSSLRIYAEQLAHYTRDTWALGFDHLTTSGSGWGVRVRNIDYFRNHWRSAQFSANHFVQIYGERYVSAAGAVADMAAYIAADPFVGTELQRYQLDVQWYRPFGDGRLVLGAQWWRDKGVAEIGVANTTGLQSAEPEQANYYNVSLSWEIRW